MERSNRKYRPFITINVVNEWAGVSKDFLHIYPIESSNDLIRSHKNLELSKSGYYQLAFVISSKNESSSEQDIINANFQVTGVTRHHSKVNYDYAEENELNTQILLPASEAVNRHEDYSDHIFAVDQTLIFQLRVSPKFFYPFPKHDDTIAKLEFTYPDPMVNINDPLLEVQKNIDFTIIDEDKIGISVDGSPIQEYDRINFSDNILAELTLKISANLKNQHQIIYNLQFKA